MQLPWCAMELEVVTKLSSRPALEANDLTALTKEQQETLNQHKVRAACHSSSDGWNPYSLESDRKSGYLKKLPPNLS